MRGSFICLFVLCMGCFMATSCMRQLSEACIDEDICERSPLSHYFIETKTGCQIDSVMGAIFCQHDPDMRMLNQILKIGDSYRLAITQEEANRLGIPDTIYQKYQTYVNSLNNAGGE